MTYSEAVKYARIPLGFALGIAYLIWAHPNTDRFVIGGLIALAGVIIRAWAAGHIVKNHKLATSGPYAHTRNPLYLGSFLIAIGFAIAAHWLLLIVVAGFFLAVYYPVMQREITNMNNRFPEAYPRYAANVPLFIPRLTPWRGDDQSMNGFSHRLYMSHGEWKASVTYVLAMAWLAFRAYGT